MNVQCGDYELEYEIYSVEQERGDKFYTPDWHEYQVTLTKNGHYIDDWDSLQETYNGMVSQRLTRIDCENAIQDIIKDIESGNASNWFTVYQEQV